MTTITIPKELVKRGDLVLMPRDEYEALLFDEQFELLRKKHATLCKS